MSNKSPKFMSHPRSTRCNLPLVFQFFLQISAVFLDFSELILLFHQLLLQLRQLFCLEVVTKSQNLTWLTFKMQIATNSRPLVGTRGVVLPFSLWSSVIWLVTSSCNFICTEKTEEK